MSLQSDKIEVAKTLLETKSEALVKQVKAVLKSYESDLWDELSEYQKNCVREAQEEFNQGKGKPHKEVMKKYKKWLTK
jgi:chromatin segregation and condensation protein Rec8/ScpA/Scc1 (kleisin family)